MRTASHQSRRRGGRPKGSTRERILEVALDLFTNHGYDKTSLREIADVLGFTKAALYYHFERKEDILLALHLRLHDLGAGALERLTRISQSGADVDSWMDGLDQFIDQVVANRTLFLLHLRNANALESIDHEQHDADHVDMQEQLQQALGSSAIPLPIRVRMACAIGAVMGTLMTAGDAFSDVPAEQLAELVRGAVHDLMGGGTRNLSGR